MRAAVYSSYSRYPLIEAKKNNHKPPKDSGNTPARITSNVKQNLRFVKEFKRTTPTEPIPSNTFRRKKGTKKPEELLEDSDLNYEILDAEDPITLVDGYNMCGYWEKLKPDFKAGRLQSARDKLIFSLIKHHQITKEKIVVVFDAVNSGLRSRKQNFLGVDIVYSSKGEADDWIVKKVEYLKASRHPVLVVTSDIIMQNESIELGATVWNCKTFISGLQDSEEEYKEISKRIRVEEMKASRPVKEPAPMAPMAYHPALMALREKLLKEEEANKPSTPSNENENENAIATPMAIQEQATLDQVVSPNGNGSLPKEIPKKEKYIKPRGTYKDIYVALFDLKRRLS